MRVVLLLLLLVSVFGMGYSVCALNGIRRKLKALDRVRERMNTRFIPEWCDGALDMLAWIEGKERPADEKGPRA